LGGFEQSLYGQDRWRVVLLRHERRMFRLRGLLAVAFVGLGLAYLSGHLAVEKHIAGAGLYAILFLFGLIECRHVNLIQAVNGRVEEAEAGSLNPPPADGASVAGAPRWSLRPVPIFLLRRPFHLTLILIAIVGALWLAEAFTGFP
jgi:hypothetical protein